jgi:hypothetical protein
VSTITLSPGEEKNNYFKPIANGRKLSYDVNATSRAQSRDNVDRATRKNSRKQSTTQKAGKIYPDSTDRLNSQRKISQSSTNLSLGSDFSK